MNSATKNLPRHLAALRGHAKHPTAYEKALDYFMREFAGDTGLTKLGERVQSPGFEGVLAHCVSRAMNRRLDLAPVVLIKLTRFEFLHGWALADGHILVFFFFESDRLGIVGVTPGLEAGVEVVRFRAATELEGHEMN